MPAVYDGREYQTPLHPAIAEDSRRMKGLQRTESLQLRGQARRATTPVLRRELTDDSLQGVHAGQAARPAVSRATPLRRSQSSRSCHMARQRSPPSAWPCRSVVVPGATAGADYIVNNGTTFSSRCNKYVVHCTARVDDQHYLTPTQRTARDLKRLRVLLDKAYSTIQQKDIQISRLKQEMGALRVCRSSPPSAPSAASLDLNATRSEGGSGAPFVDSPDLSVTRSEGDSGALSASSLDLSATRSEGGSGAPSASSLDLGATRSEGGSGAPSASSLDLSATRSDGGSGMLSPVSGSADGQPDGQPPPAASVCGDSGACDCGTPPSVGCDREGSTSCDQLAALELEHRLGDDWEATEHWIEWEEKRLRQEHHLRITELNRQHAAEYQEMKEKYNDKVEALLQQLADANGRYFELRPQHDAACLRTRQLELELALALHTRTADRDSATQTAELAADPDPAQPAPAAADLLHQLHCRDQQLERVRGYWGSVFNLRSSARACSSAGPPAAARDVWTAATHMQQKGLYQQQLSALEVPRHESAQSAEMDSSTRLQFLRSAVYHYLTDRGDYAGHLKAIAAVLRFTDWEIQQVERARGLRA